MRTRKIYSGLTLAAAALLCLTGCKKDEEGEKIMLGTQFEKAVSAQKTYLGENNTVCWSSEDKVKVNGNNPENEYSVSADGIAVESADNYYAVYPATNTVNKDGGTVEIPASQTYTLDEQSGKQVLNGPMAARLDSRSGKLYFRNLYSLLKVTVAADDKDFTVNSITVTATGETPKALAGSFGFTFNGATTTDEPTVSDEFTGSTTVTLTCGSDNTVSANDDKDFYLVVHPMTTAQNLKVEVRGMADGKMVVYTYNTLSTRTLNRNSIGGLAVNLQQLTAEPIRFSIDEGKYVTFSLGNLQYCASSNTWHFAEHQYDFIGDAVGNTTAVDYRATQTDWIDLFGWGTSGYADGRKSTEAYQPWTTSTVDEEYRLNGVGNTNLSGKTDWGYNCIVNGGNTVNSGWRTLTKIEWDYLLGVSGAGRSNGYTEWWIYNMITIKKVDGNNDVSGLIIYPDGVTAQPAGLSVTLTQNGKKLADISKDDFKKLELLGCVFLPMAGKREGTKVDKVGLGGYYWSSTCFNANKAYNLYFYGGNMLYPIGGSGRYLGISVRLVKDVE